MPTVTVEPDVLAKFKQLFEDEGNDEAKFRIKEVKVGGGCKSHIELRVSLDEAEDPDEEVYLDVDGVPFVISNDMLESYGDAYRIFNNTELNIPGVQALNH